MLSFTSLSSTDISRWRQCSRGVLAVGATALLITSCSSSSTDSSAGTAHCESVTETSLALSTADLDVSYIPYGILADNLGYFSEECLDVTVEVTSSTVEQSVVTGQVDFGMTSPDALIMAAETTQLDARFVYNLIPQLNIFLATAPDSGIKTGKDLAGAKIGISGPTPIYNTYMQRYLSEFGLGLDDITFVTTAYGATAMEALKSGAVDAVLYWPGLFTAWELSGYKVTMMPDPAWASGLDGIGLIARNEVIDSTPDVVEKVSRAIAKSAVYLKHHPEEAVKTFWDHFPARAPLPGADEKDSLAKDLAILNATLQSMHIDTNSDDYNFGIQTIERWTNQVEYLKTAGLLTKDVDPQSFFYIDHMEATNNFDRSEITEAQ